MSRFSHRLIGTDFFLIKRKKKTRFAFARLIGSRSMSWQSIAVLSHEPEKPPLRHLPDLKISKIISKTRKSGRIARVAYNRARPSPAVATLARLTSQ